MWGSEMKECFLSVGVCVMLCDDDDVMKKLIKMKKLKFGGGGGVLN